MSSVPMGRRKPFLGAPGVQLLGGYVLTTVLSFGLACERDRGTVATAKEYVAMLQRSDIEGSQSLLAPDAEVGDVESIPWGELGRAEGEEVLRSRDSANVVVEFGDAWARHKKAAYMIQLVRLENGWRVSRVHTMTTH